MEEYFDVERNESDVFNKHTRKSANTHLFKAWQAYKDITFISKKKRLKLIKRLALENVMMLRENLAHGNWVCLTKQEKKRNTVGDYLNEVGDSIIAVTDFKQK